MPIFKFVTPANAGQILVGVSVDGESTWGATGDITLSGRVLVYGAQDAPSGNGDITARVTVDGQSVAAVGAGDIMVGVSVGESLAAIPLIRALKEAHPELPLLVTTTTRTGADQIAKLGDLVIHRYAPLDYPDAVWRFLQRTRPRALGIMETELWPNWLAACARRQMPVVVMN